MELNLESLKDVSAWEQAGIGVPAYDVEAAARLARERPRWVHMGIGNIFRVFIAGIADELLASGDLDRGITCVEAYDFEIVDRIYRPFDNLGVNVILYGDGSRDIRVTGSMAEAVKACPGENGDMERLKEIFRSEDLQLVSFTITEKGYSLYASDGSFLPGTVHDIEEGPGGASGAVGILTAMLLERYRGGGHPVALVSMDNVSRNGALLQEAVAAIAREWAGRGYVPAGFTEWIADPSRVSFPWTMIDKITPRPAAGIAEDLERLGLRNMAPLETGKRTYIAPFANAEEPQYLVIEDAFSNGRPVLENGHGVFLADRETVDKAERMKVSSCLNPVHSALGPLGVVLGIELFPDLLKDPVLLKMGKTVLYDEGLPMAPHPGILSPNAFADELFADRFPNEYLGDTNLRLSTDVSKGLGVRFGVTMKAYAGIYGSAERLTGIPLGIAAWLRYMLAVDDAGNPYELAPDPMNEEISQLLAPIRIGEPQSLTDQLVPVLSNPNLFFSDLYEIGIGKKIEEMFRDMIRGKGAVRETVCRYFG